MPTTFDTVGTHSWSPPSGTQKVIVTVNGAGGGNGADNYDAVGGTGGSGGHIEFEVSATGSDTLEALVGDGGATPAGGTGPHYNGGDGGAGDEGGQDGGGGGASTAVELNGTQIATADAGGGGAGAADYIGEDGGPGGGGARGGSGGYQGTGGAGSAGDGGGSGQGGDGASYTDATTDSDPGDNGGNGGQTYDSGAVSNVSTSTGGGSAAMQSGSVTFEGVQAPAAPNNASQTVGGADSSTATWDDDTSEGDTSHFDLEISEDGGAWSLVDGNIPASTTSYTASVTAGVDTVRFRVRAVNDAGTSGWSYTTTKSTEVTTLSVSNTTSDSFDLSWDAADDATDYDVLLAESSGSSESDYSIDQTVTTTSATVSGLENGEQYYARVIARYPQADSLGEVEADTITDTPAPSLDSLDASTKREITSNYTLNDNSSDGDVLVERSDDGGSTWTIVGTVTDLSLSSFTDAGLLDGTDYTYRLTRRTDHDSAQSGMLTAQTILPAPSGLSVVSGSVTNDTADITFEDHANNKDGYRAYTGPDGYLSFPGDGSKASGSGDWSSIGTGAYTIVAVARWDDLSRDSANLGQSVFRDEGGNSYQFNLYGGNNSINTYDNNATGSLSWGGPEGEFVTVAARRYDDGTRELYGNGSVRDSDTSPTDITSTGGYEYGTSDDDTDSKSLDGAIHRLAVYDVALSDAEIDGFGNGEMPTSAAPLLFQEFNRGSGSTVTDYSGNGYDGTISDSTTGTTWHGGGSLSQNGGDLPPQYGLQFPDDGAVTEIVCSGSGGAYPFSNGVRVEMEVDPLDNADDRWLLSNHEWVDPDGDGTSEVRGIWLRLTSTNSLRWKVGDGTTSTTAIGSIDPTKQLSVVAWMDASNGDMALEVNGATLDSATGAVIGTSNQDLHHGNFPGGNASHSYDGVIDGVSLYDDPNGNNLVGKWDYNDGPGSAVVMDSVQNYDGDIYGCDWTASLKPVRHTLSGLLDGERYVTRASVFTSDAGEVFDN